MPKIKREHYLRAMINVRCDHCGEMITINFSEKNFPNRNKKWDDYYVSS